MPTPARRAAFQILLRVETQASFASDLLHGELTERLTERDAAFCTALVLGTLRWQGTLDFIARSFAAGKWERFDSEVRVALRLGLYQLRFTRVPARAAISESVDLVKAAGKSSAAKLVNAVLRKTGQVELASLRPAQMSDVEWAGIETSHPRWLLERWGQRCGAEQAQALARANNQPPATSVRANSEATPEELTQVLLAEGVETAPGNLLRSALAVRSGSITRSESYRCGALVIQDEASQLVPHLLDVQAGEGVLDLCAAPGNKTGLLARWAGPSGSVIACDIHLHRLRQFLLPPSLANIRRVMLDGEQPLPFRPIFDRVLVDAPCSGTGTLRRNPELKWRLTPAAIPRLAETQSRLLHSAAAVLKPEGRLVYSTCSLEREENQGVVEQFLKTHLEFRLLPLRDDARRVRPFLQAGAEHLLESDYLETSPAREDTDGFFAAILTK
jgi:16S rRNA (cytosine967-C5)-methyltransferase